MADFFAPYKQEEIQIRQFKGKSPMFFRRFTMMGAYVTADLNVVNEWIPEGLSAVTLPGGIAVLAIHCFEYKESDIGPYNEVSVAVAVQPMGFRVPHFIRLGYSRLMNEYHGFVKVLPVTTEVAVYGGLDFFNYPKELGDISYRESAQHRICTVRNPGELDLSMEWEMKTTELNRKPSKITFYSYPVVAGRVQKAKLYVDTRAWSENVPGKGTFDWRFGKGKNAELLKGASLGRVISSFYLPDCRGVLFPPHSSPK